MGEPAVDAWYEAAKERIRDKLSEEEKKGNGGKFIEYVYDVVHNDGWSFCQAQKHVREVCKLRQHEATLEQLPDVGEGAIQKVREFRKENSSEEWSVSYLRHVSETLSTNQLDELYEEVATEITTTNANTNKLVLDSVKQYTRQRSNELITDMVKGSASVTAYQALNIYMAWKTISKASNLILENENEFHRINRSLERMEKSVVDFLRLCDGDPDDRTLYRKMMRISALFTSILDKITNLKVNIDGHIQRLDLLADNSVIDGFTNLATAVSQGYQLWHTWEKLSSFTKALAVASVAVFTFLGLGDFRTSRLSRNILMDLRKDLNEAKRFQDMLEDLHEKAEEAVSALPE